MDIDSMEKIRGLFVSQQLAVLATRQGGQPYTSLVAFAFSDDLRQLFFATTRATRKFSNLQAEPRVSLLIDNRSDDFREAIAVTALGRAQEVSLSQRPALLGLYLDRHADLKEFVTAPTCALLQVEVTSYSLVSRFQNVVDILIEP
jgi:uncharacterized protein YhbP (UPF0306 family)